MNKDDKKIIDLKEEFDENILNDEFAGIIRDGLDEAFDADKLVVSEALIAKTLAAINKLDSEKKDGQTDAAVEKTLESVEDKKITSLNETKKTQKKRWWKQAAGIVAALLVVGVGIITIRGGIYKSSEDTAVSNGVNATSSDMAMETPMESSMATSDKNSYSTESKQEYSENVEMDNSFASNATSNNYFNSLTANSSSGDFGDSNEAKTDSFYGSSDEIGAEPGEGIYNEDTESSSDNSNMVEDDGADAFVGIEQGTSSESFIDYEAYIREVEKYYEVLEYLNENLVQVQDEVTFAEEMPQYSYEIALVNDSFTDYSGETKFVNVYTNAVTVGARWITPNEAGVSLEGVYLVDDFDNVLEAIKSICERKWPTN